MNTKEQKNSLIEVLRQGGIAVVRTDTLYGVIALASSQTAVEKVYAAKHRDTTKQCIVLIDRAAAEASEYAEEINDYSGSATIPTTVVVPATSEAEWLLRGGATMAYRVTRDPFLRAVIKEVGPVIAPSANPEGEQPASTIAQAKAYFGESVDIYVDGGEVPSTNAASEILAVKSDGSVEVIRSQFYKQGQGTGMAIKEHHSAGGLIFKDNKVLLIHWDKPRDTYDFPKGHIDEGESSEETALREVFEETGYKTKVAQYIDSNAYYFQTPKGKWSHKTVDYYLLDLIEDAPYDVARESHETFENVWVDIAQAPSVITKAINIDIFNKALKLRATESK